MEPLGKRCNACNAAQCTFPSMTHSSSGRRRFRPDWVVTSLRNADVTWPRCARRLPCCQAAERRIAWFASFVSNDSLAQPRRLPDRRFINFTWAEHLLRGSLVSDRRRTGEEPRLPCTPHWKCQSRARKVIVVVCVAKYRLFHLLCTRSLSFSNSDGAEPAFGPLSPDWDELLANCGLKVILYLLLKSFSYVLR